MDDLEQVLAKDDLTSEEIVGLLDLRDSAELESLRRAAYDAATAVSGDNVFMRGLVEMSNVCSRDCFYCGIRRSNRAVERYQLEKAEIVECALWSARQGYGSCVIQSGERQDAAFAEFVEDCVREIKAGSRSADLPDGLGITLSLGEQSEDVYRRWFEAGAHRYLMRIETSNPDLFRSLHPESQTFESRLQSLSKLNKAGYQVGTGVMIGLPGQTVNDLANDILFFKERDIDMIGMGPYITHPGTPMADRGMMDRDELLRLTLNMVATTRLVLKDVNIAATTAMQTIAPDGREQAIACGANVVMPNLTPVAVRENYLLYSGKPCIDEDRAECRGCLSRRIESVGRRVGWNDWGDAPHFARRRGESDATA